MSLSRVSGWNLHPLLAACVRCHGSKCPLLTLLFLLLLLFGNVTFLPEGVIVEFQNFAWGFNTHKIRFGVDFLGFFSGNKEKCLELLEMARKFN
jgi:hypothetical protein